ncbi:MAG: SDR family NAD(P)-dependent oxidoreductase [Candidatus Krumholzibacteriia bacterium]
MTRILITGASRGIGRAIALRLAGPGVTLLLHGRDRSALDRVAGEVGERGAEAEALVADLVDPVAVIALADLVASQPLDVLVNNAGAAVVGPLERLTLKDWQRSLAVGVTAPFLLMKRLATAMPAGGSVVNVSSVAVRSPFPGWAAYAAAKHALEGLSAVAREELRPRGVRVINVYPAATSTDIWNRVPGDFPRDRMMPPEETAEAVAYALSRPAGVLVDSVHVGGLGGNL